MTWRELHWAWEAKFEKETDRHAATRADAANLAASFVASHGVNVDVPDFAQLNPLEVPDG